MISWMKEFPHAITVCNAEGKILYMNDKAEKTFAKYGGKTLIGKSLMACHSPESQQKLQSLLTSQLSNSYTIEKNGVKKLISQSPWYEEGKFHGIVEISLEIPAEMPHFIRQG